MSRDDFDTWPLAEDIPAWWRDRPLTPEQLEAAREEYERAAIEDAQSAAAFAANQQEHRK